MPQRRAEGVFRILHVAQVHQGAAQVAVGLGKVRLQAQCAAVTGNRLRQRPLLPQHVAQIAMRLGVIRFQLQRPAVGCGRFVQLPLLLQREPRFLCPIA